MIIITVKYLSFYSMPFQSGVLIIELLDPKLGSLDRTLRCGNWSITVGTRTVCSHRTLGLQTCLHPRSLLSLVLE